MLSKISHLDKSKNLVVKTKASRWTVHTPSILSIKSIQLTSPEIFTHLPPYRSKLFTIHNYLLAHVRHKLWRPLNYYSWSSSSFCLRLATASGFFLSFFTNFIWIQIIQPIVKKYSPNSKTFLNIFSVSKI